MRHRLRGRKLGRNGSHRRAMFRNMAVSLIRSLRDVSGETGASKTPGRIVTTHAKAKELRPIVEKLITIGKRARVHQEAASQYAVDAERNSSEWKAWRDSDRWQQWAKAVAPALALRRRAFALLRDNAAVDVLFTDLSDRFSDRNGGYTRIVRLAGVRLGDAGPKAIIEFVGDNDRVRQRRAAPAVAAENAPATEA